MGIYSNHIKANQLIRELGPVGKLRGKKLYSDVFDCFSIPVADKWANALIAPNSGRYRTWGEIQVDFYFSIKSVPTGGKTDVPVGFQMCFYTKDEAFRKHAHALLVDAITEILGVKANTNKRKCVYWQFDVTEECCLKILELVVPKIIDLVNGDPLYQQIR